MSHETNMPSYNKNDYEPLENPEILETERDDVLAVETTFDDPEVLEMAQRNSEAMARGSIAVDNFTNLRPRKDGYTFKVVREENGQLQLSGVIYGITKGRDYRTMELAYAKDDTPQNRDEQSKGVMSAAVAAVAERFKKSHELMFDIEDTNEPSIRIARKVGAKALAADGSYTKYFTSRQR